MGLPALLAADTRPSDSLRVEALTQYISSQHVGNDTDSLLAHSEDSQQPVGAAYTYRLLGAHHYRTYSYDKAITSLKRSLRLSREKGYLLNQALTLLLMG